MPGAVISLYNTNTSSKVIFYTFIIRTYTHTCQANNQHLPPPKVVSDCGKDTKVSFAEVLATTTTVTAVAGGIPVMIAGVSGVVGPGIVMSLGTVV